MLHHAEEAVRLASADARAARRLAGEALAATEDLETRSTAERALGLAAVELGDAPAGVEHLRRAVAIAEQGGLDRRAAVARMSLSLALTLVGASSEALAALEAAEPVLDGHDRAQVQSQRAVILQKLGRLDEAVDGYRKPLAAFRRSGDALWEARLLCNRGVLQVYRGALSAAEADFLRAEELHESIGQALSATQVRHNLGWVAARRGDVPSALEWYDRVEAEYRAHGVPLALLLMDRCEVLLSARLATEARANATAAVAELDAAGLDADLAEARLLAAQAELLTGDITAARTTPPEPTTPSAASTVPAGQPWPAWPRREPRGPKPRAPRPGRNAPCGWTPRCLRRSVRCGRSRPLGGASRRSMRDSSPGGRRSSSGGRGWRGEFELAAANRDRGPVHVRTRAWHAAALVRLSHQDRRGASAAVAAGLRALEAHRMTLGASELRAHASGHGEELATLGLRLALDSGNAARVLAAAERRRAAGLLQRPARPPDEPGLAADLEELRRVTAEADEALREGRPGAELARRQAALERSIRRRALRARGQQRDARDDRMPSLSALGDRVLVEFVALDGELLAVTARDGRARLHRLGSATDIEREVGSLRFALRSVATGRHRMAQVCEAVAGKLDALLLAPLGLADRPVVLVPTGELHALPWSLLPSLAHRPLTVAPSLRLWHRAANMPTPHDPRSVYVAGPRLPAATEEIETLQARHPDAITLTGSNATIANAARAIDGADHAHVAAHGRFRDDNPLFTSLELADGLVTVYDLERLRRVPRRIVLSSCESGLSAVHAGDELMGFTAAVFALGTQTVIAAVVPVPDEATKGLMLKLDEELTNGIDPATALMNARPADNLATSAFVCFGAG